MRHGLSNQRLPAARRAIQQHPLRWTQRKIPIQLRVSKRQLNSVMNLLNLRIQTTNIVVGHIRHLLQYQTSNFSLGDNLERVTRAGVDKQRVPRPWRLSLLQQRSGKLHHMFLAARIHYQRAGIRQHLRQRGQLPRGFKTTHLHHLRALPNAHPRAGNQRGAIHTRRDHQPHASIRGKHLGAGPAWIDVQQHPIRAWWGGQRLQLLVQYCELVAGSLQRLGKLRIPRPQLTVSATQYLQISSIHIRRCHSVQPPPRGA